MAYHSFFVKSLNNLLNHDSDKTKNEQKTLYCETIDIY